MTSEINDTLHKLMNKTFDKTIVMLTHNMNAAGAVNNVTHTFETAKSTGSSAVDE